MKQKPKSEPPKREPINLPSLIAILANVAVQTARDTIEGQGRLDPYYVLGHIKGLIPHGPLDIPFDLTGKLEFIMTPYKNEGQKLAASELIRIQVGCEGYNFGIHMAEMWVVSRPMTEKQIRAGKWRENYVRPADDPNRQDGVSIRIEVPGRVYYGCAIIERIVTPAQTFVTFGDIDWTDLTDFYVESTIGHILPINHLLIKPIKIG